MFPGMSERRNSTFVERVLDGHARVDELEAEVQSWAAGPRRRPLHEVLGLDADELELVALTPDALRYVLHARRFGRTVSRDELSGQARVRDHSMRLAADVVDPFDLAEIETWRSQVDAHDVDSREPSHA
jgi:hypothetical protein